MVIVIERELKRDLYVELARRGLTLKAWFIDQATRFLDASRQPSLFPMEDIPSHRPRVPSDISTTAKEGGE